MDLHKLSISNLQELATQLNVIIPRTVNYTRPLKAALTGFLESQIEAIGFASRNPPLNVDGSTQTEIVQDTVSELESKKHGSRRKRKKRRTGPMTQLT